MLPPHTAPEAGWNGSDELLAMTKVESSGGSVSFGVAATLGAVSVGGGAASLRNCGNLGRMKSKRRSPAGPCNRRSIGLTLETTSPAATAVAAISTDATIALI